MDTVDSVARSRMMAGIKGRNTRPEMIVRRFLHANGYRFRLHRRDLPGSPDIVLSRLRVCIFVHGCFWHRHLGCHHTTSPKTRVDFWQEKFNKNVERDARAKDALLADGWKVLTIWECELKSSSSTLENVLDFLRCQGS
ncbi:very short patch repair endonuclease [Pseudomonas mosselii]|uniref:very short patch repair endonuclease n=1 Tax=Pseudomonas mosselii TaxID=78327 RepID=UPI000A122AB1|nr:very short patch repair endonuclease [Pseudomonas mosselii]ORT73634.1 very short patch repair endonuclease [Pseudomonas mosselii]